MTELHMLDVASLETHPWQVNVPDMSGTAWDEFLADVKKRGIQDPIRVSYRTGSPVIVDGHQRTRAARELGIDRLPGMVQVFEDEASEVEYLVGAALHRRNLTTMQAAQLGMKREAYFAEAALERQKAGKTLPSIEGKVEERHERSSTAQAAAAVGLSRPTYERAKTVIKDAPPIVRKAAERGEISVNAAHIITTKAPEPLRVALNVGGVNVPDASDILKDKELSRQVEAGEKTVHEAASHVSTLRAEKKKEDAESGAAANHKMTSLLTRIRDISQAEWDHVENSAFNQQFGSTFRADWLRTAQHMLALEAHSQAHRTLDARPIPN